MRLVAFRDYKNSDLMFFNTDNIVCLKQCSKHYGTTWIITTSGKYLVFETIEDVVAKIETVQWKNK